MSEKESEKKYPVRTLHAFLSELNKEWRSFKRGTLISLFLIMLLVALVPLSFRAIARDTDIFAYVFPIVLAAFLIYSIRTMIAQYRFFRKWGHRMEQLVSLEEKLMSEKPEENESKQPPL